MEVPARIDPTEPVSEAYTSHLEETRQLVALNELVQKVADFVLESGEQNERSQEVREKLEVVNENLVRKNEELANKEDILRESERLRRHREEIIEIPPDGPGIEGWYPMDDCKKSFGTITYQNIGRDLKQFLDRMFKCGRNANYSHADYMSIMGVCFQGELYDVIQQMSRQNYTFQQIIDHFYTVYCRPKDYTHYENQLRNFCRFRDEPIKATMKRYILTATSADELVPAQQAYWSTSHQKIIFLEMALQGDARDEYRRWRKTQLQSGLYFDYDSCFSIAEKLEQKYGSVPSQNIFITTRTEINTRNVSSNIETHNQDFSNPEKQLTYAEIAAMGVKRDRKGNPIKRDNQNPIDPHRSSLPRASFYNSRSNPKIKSFPPNRDKPYSIGRKTFGNGNFRGTAYSRRGHTSAGRQNYFIRNSQKTPNNQRSGGFQQKYGNEKQLRQPNVRNSQISGYARGNAVSYGNSARGYEKAKGVFNKRQGHEMPNLYTQRIFGQNTNRGYRRPGYQYPQNQETQQKNNLNNYNQQGRKRISPQGRYSNNQVRKNLFCMRCGVDVSNPQTSRMQSDHTTDNCRIYPLWNPNTCGFCIRRGIKAHHWDAHCLAKSSQIQSADYTD